MLATTNIHVVDEGYSVAQHLLVEIEQAGVDGCTSAQLREALAALSGAQVGAWLRDLRCRGWIASMPVSPASTRVRWSITDAGRAYLSASS